MWIDKIRQDFDLAIVVMFGIITNLVILPFAVYRFLGGQLLAGTIDMLIVLGISVGATRVYVSGRVGHVALILAMTYSIGCIAIAYVVGPAGSLWMYAVLLSTFLLIERNRAVLISAIGIAAVAGSPLALPEAAQKATFIGSTIVVSLFSYVFAWRTDLQRRQLENLASLDPLTGARNRRGMDAEIETAMAASTRSGKPLGLIIFDLDHFKRINDLFGHEAGDQVLVQVAETVRRYTRKNDRFFRHGGEEFALLIPDSDPIGLRDLTEKVRLAVQHGVHCGDLGVTVSLGASVLRSGESASEWQARADSAMYRAKREGRNRSVVDELEPDTQLQAPVSAHAGLNDADPQLSAPANEQA
jgi:diguanylate cyclase